MCDACIRVIDEKLALGVSRRFGKGVAAALASESDNQQEHAAAAAAPMEPDKGGNRTVMTMGRYRCVRNMGLGMFAWQRSESNSLVCWG